MREEERGRHPGRDVQRAEALIVVVVDVAVRDFVAGAVRVAFAGCFDGVVGEACGSVAGAVDLEGEAASVVFGDYVGDIGEEEFGGVGGCVGG